MGGCACPLAPIPAWASRGRRVCCNGLDVLDAAAMAAAIYLALVGGGLTLAVAASFVLRGIKLI